MERKSVGKKAECPFCATSFKHRSSLVRHLRKNCNQPQQHTIRRKSCHQCVSDKARCTLERPSCSRCATKNVNCQYPGTTVTTAEITYTSAPVRTPREPQSNSDDILASIFSGLENWEQTHQELIPCSPQHADSSDTVIVDDSTLECLDTDMGLDGIISNSFLYTEPSAETPSAALTNHSMEFIFRVLRTWPRMMAEEFQLPPLIHPTQVSKDRPVSPPLANCITLVKMWHGQCEGTEEMVFELIYKKLSTLLDTFEDLDEETLLAVLQAVVFYTIVLLFPAKGSLRTLSNGSVFAKIQRLVYHVVGTGLFLQEERSKARPSWEAWIHVTSKRRAIVSLYLLHWSYSVFHNIPSFDCRELGFMPAPASKLLWEAHSEQEWNCRYIHWLSRWNGQGYLQGEFDQIKPGIVMPERAEKWLEEADEFGFIMMTIVNATEFKPPAFGALVL